MPLVLPDGLDSLEELATFLKHPVPDVRAMAAQIALSISASEEGRRGLVEAQVLPTLCRLSADTDKVAEPAISAMINLCADELPSVVQELLKRGIVDRLVETVTSEDCSCRDRALMLLANVSATTTGAKRVMQQEEEEEEEEEEKEEEEEGNTDSRDQEKRKKKEEEEEEDDKPAAGTTLPSSSSSTSLPPSRGKKETTTVIKEKKERKEKKEKTTSLLTGLHIRRLLRCFLSHYDPAAEEDEWQYVSSVLHNVTQLQEGRDLLRRRTTNLLGAVLPQLESRNPIRRRGVACTIRNCCFEEGDHYYYIHEMALIAHLLFPLMGSDRHLDADERQALHPLVLRGGSNKQREPDEAVRTALLETLLLFCSTRSSREALRRQGVYAVVREADKSEPSEENSEIIYKIVNFLQRDEETRHPAANDGKEGSTEGGREEGLNEGPDEDGREGGEASLPRPLSDLKERAELDLEAFKASLAELD
ncbi:hypothetical protein VYU27_007618 [Nannochloropsis oceanica]